MSSPTAGSLSRTARKHSQLGGHGRNARSIVACLQCRERKVRCSGTHPCANCAKRSVDCCFEQQERKITVSERYLTDLKRRASLLSQDHHAPRTPTHRNASMHSPAITDVEDHGEADALAAGAQGSAAASRSSSNRLAHLKNPLMTMPSNFLTDNTGRRRFLGPSSTWAYTRHVMGIIRGVLDSPDSPDIPLNVDGTARPLDIHNEPSPVQVSISKDHLPSLDYALYLVNTVKFHVGQTYHIFDEPSLMQSLYSFHNEALDLTDPRRRLSYIHYLIIIAFGKALLNRNSSGGKQTVSPSGSEYFAQALQLFPDASGLYANPIIGVEICCALALYMQSVDHRNSAYVYLGTGLRLALTQGLHRDLNVSVEEHDRHRYQNAWWTLYVLDRKFSSQMGAPSSIHDCDIYVSLPEPEQSVRNAALNMHVKLSRLIAEVLNTVYSSDGRLHSSFLQSVQTILRKLAALAKDLNASPELTINNRGPIGRVSATLNLCHHQCIVLATRPLLIVLLHQKLEERSRAGDAGSLAANREVSNPIKALLKTSYDSAKKSLRILEMLRAQDLLEMFLPFDLDHAFSSGFVLTLFSALQPFPEASIDNSHFHTTLGLLDALIINGNATAKFRREELERLNEMLRLVALEGRAKSDSPGLDHTNETVEETGTAMDPQLMPSNGGFLQVLGQGVSPDQWLTVASLLSDYPTMNLVPEMMDASWMWEGDDEDHWSGNPNIM